MPELPKRKLSEEGIATSLSASARVVTYTSAADEPDPKKRVKTAPLPVLATALRPFLPLSATLTEDLFVFLLAEAQLGTYVNRDLYITRAPGLGTLSTHVTGNATFEPDGMLFDPNDPDVPGTPVEIRVVGGALVVTPRAAYSAITALQDLQTAPVWATNAEGTYLGYSSFQAACLQMADSGTLRVRRSQDFGNTYAIVKAAVLTIDAGAVLAGKEIYATSLSGKLLVTGQGTCAVNAFSLSTAYARQLEVRDLGLLSSSIVPYVFDGSNSGGFDIAVTRTNWIRAGKLLDAEYYLTGRTCYARVRVSGCYLESTANDLFVFTGNASSAATAGNLLQLAGNVIKGPANKRVLNDDAGQLTFQRGGNTYLDIAPPAQSYAVLLPGDGGPTGPAPAAPAITNLVITPA